MHNFCSTLAILVHKFTFLPGNVHEVMVDLEGMGGGGQIQLEVRF